MLAVTGISRHGFFCYQTSIPLNKFVCKLYNVGDDALGVPLFGCHGVKIIAQF